ncbi:MAG: hypothetical protein M3130_09500 [Actinomycetota bacterium]|nr:hypothetical protein [Actinomycetota bacterium]
MTAPLTRDVVALAGIFVTSGVLHLVKPEIYEPLMPATVPAHRAVIIGSGIAELGCAVGLLHPRTRKLAGWASAGLLLGVFPANLKMANDVRHSRKTGRKVAAFGRLPLQAPLIRTALRAARG